MRIMWKFFLYCLGESVIKNVDANYPNQQIKVLIKSKREKQNI